MAATQPHELPSRAGTGLTTMTSVTDEAVPDADPSSVSSPCTNPTINTAIENQVVADDTISRPQAFLPNASRRGSTSAAISRTILVPSKSCTRTRRASTRRFSRYVEPGSPVASPAPRIVYADSTRQSRNHCARPSTLRPIWAV